MHIWIEKKSPSIIIIDHPLFTQQRLHCTHPCICDVLYYWDVYYLLYSCFKIWYLRCLWPYVSLLGEGNFKWLCDLLCGPCGAFTIRTAKNMSSALSHLFVFFVRLFFSEWVTHMLRNCSHTKRPIRILPLMVRLYLTTIRWNRRPSERRSSAAQEQPIITTMIINTAMKKQE